MPPATLASVLPGAIEMLPLIALAAAVLVKASVPELAANACVVPVKATGPEKVRLPGPVLLIVGPLTAPERFRMVAALVTPKLPPAPMVTPRAPVWLAPV